MRNPHYWFFAKVVVLMGSFFPVDAAENIRITPRTKKFEVKPGQVLEFRVGKNLVVHMENYNTRFLKGEALKEADGKLHPPKHGVVRTARYRVLAGSASLAAETVLTASNAPQLRGTFEKVVPVIDRHFFDTWALAAEKPLPETLFVRHVQWVAVGTEVIASFEIIVTPMEIRVYYDPSPSPPADFQLASAPSPKPPPAEAPMPEAPVLVSHKGDTATTVVALAKP